MHRLRDGGGTTDPDGESPERVWAMGLARYSQKDAEVTLHFHQAWDAKFILVGGRYYNRQEWKRYCLERRRWTRDDPTVVVPMPASFSRWK